MPVGMLGAMCLLQCDMSSALSSVGCNKPVVVDVEQGFPGAAKLL